MSYAAIDELLTARENSNATPLQLFLFHEVLSGDRASRISRSAGKSCSTVER